MASTAADSITLDVFQDILQKYPDLVKSIAKPPKAGHLSLEELDRFRYIDAPSHLSIKTDAKQFALSDIQKLVQWKIHHGKFRPFLPKLVASNTEDKAREVTKAAFSSYATKRDIKATLKIIEKLKGIGPATSSLILAVHDPENVMFFSDEAYHWLCASGSESLPDLKYTSKEYDELDVKVKKLMARLKVSPTDVEKVSYVLKHTNGYSSAKGPPGKLKSGSLPQDNSKDANATIPRPRGLPRSAAKAEVEEATEKTLEDNLVKPRDRPKSVSEEEKKDDVKEPVEESSVSKPRGRANATQKARTSKVEAESAKPSVLNRKSKRKTTNNATDVEEPVRKRGHPKGKTG
ncbi:hypothetical protein BJ878DRAFT_450760 [Calycina marina]|uniref:Uncharacterized protein n=1 Tax=Calycina marina TaxID=1763456 RepID=A0A9P7ZCN9_9HELO|nr:hypothetical protein BJ878DRAFT_450760 [Calycina marina]